MTLQSLLLISLTVLMLDVAPTRADESKQSPERMLQAAAEVLAEKFRVDWNSHDMDAMGQLLTADADFVNVIGMHMKGRAQIVARHKEVHRTQFKNSVWVTHSVEAQLLAPGFGLVHVNWGISGDLDPDGTSRPPRDGIFSWLLVKQADGTWLIRSVQNTNIRRP
jgi:uncharacterized protein (TIGR02246 family)